MRILAGLACMAACIGGVLGLFGCAAPYGDTTIIVYLRDDAAGSDVDALSSMLDSNPYVSRAHYVHENVMLTEEAAAAAGAPTDGPEGNPLARAWFELDVPADSHHAVLAAIESHPAFSRTVLVPRNGDWWHVR